MRTKVTRRAFVRDGLAGLAALSVVPPAWPAGRDGPARTGTKILVVVVLRGGADGLNLVVPWREPDYYRLRPTIAIAPPGTRADAGIDLDGCFAFHPRMAPLVPWYRAGRLLVVHACGLADAPATHLGAGEYLHTGVGSGDPDTSGWLNRYLAATGTNAQARLRAVATCRTLPRCLEGPVPAVLIADADVTADSYPATRVGRALARIAQLVKAGAGVEVAVVESAGWDTHVGQGGVAGPFADRVGDLAGALNAFLDDLGDRASDVLVVTLSEFGRSVAENRYGGTDHGRGGVLLAIGGVAGGVRGGWPGLAPAGPAGPGLAVAHDVRAELAALVGLHAGLVDPSRLFPARS